MTAVVISLLLGFVLLLYLSPFVLLFYTVRNYKETSNESVSRPER
jgi:hypothetical protein